MFKILIAAAAALLVIGIVTVEISPPTRAATPQIEHGRYIVEHVGMCVQCHTPRTENGTLNRQRLLEGAPVPVKSPFPSVQWAFRAPDIAGLPGWNAEDAITLLMTGKRPDGQPPRPPMPPFMMTHEDASAVVAYLKSL